MNQRTIKMFMRKPIKLSIVFLITALVAMGCSTNSPNSQSATIEGSVQPESSKQKVAASSIEGAVVTAARVTSEGSLETMEGTETETNASGNFMLEVDVEAAENIVIVAKKEGNEWRGFLSSKVQNGSTVTMKPINTESTAESSVFAEVVSSGNTDIVQKSDIEAVVTNDAASEIESGLTSSAQIAAALKNSAEARVEFYSEMMQDNSEEALAETYELLAEAQFRLEAELAASSTAEARSEAYDVFVESTVNAYVNAGLDASATAKALEMWSRVTVNSMTAVSSEIKNDVRAQASLIAATAIDLAVQAEAEATEMSESSRQAIIDAGVELRSEIEASAGVASEVEAAFEAYHDKVRNTMESDTTFEATVILNIDNEINSDNGAKSNFSSSISGILKASAVFDVYESFFTSIQGTVESNLSGSSESEIEAVSQIMILINLAS
jgi:predicted HicB family RNase H-like nuclease